MLKQDPTPTMVHSQLPPRPSPREFSPGRGVHGARECPLLLCSAYGHSTTSDGLETLWKQPPIVVDPTTAPQRVSLVALGYWH
jgi:hypothetical protein